MLTTRARASRRSQQGRPSERRILCLLSPSHHDTLEEQHKSFPRLATLPPDSVARLRARLVRTDDASFRQFMRGIVRAAAQ